MTDKEKMLYNSLDEIRDCKRYIKQETKHVWGKDVIRYYTDENGNLCRTENVLENWYIKLPCNENTHIPTLRDCFKSLVEQRENGILKTIEESHKFTCYQLCDWQWLPDERGKIVKNGYVTLAKYAIILEDLE